MIDPKSKYGAWEAKILRQPGSTRYYVSKTYFKSECRIYLSNYEDVGNVIPMKCMYNMRINLNTGSGFVDRIEKNIVKHKLLFFCHESFYMRSVQRAGRV